MKRRNFIKVIIAAGVAVNVPVALLTKPEEYEFCIESQRLFDAMIEQFPMDVKIATDIHIREMKESGMWETLDVLYRFDKATNTHDACLNWISPGKNDCLINGAGTFNKGKGIKKPDGLTVKGVSIGENRINVETIPEFKPTPQLIDWTKCSANSPL